MLVSAGPKGPTPVRERVKFFFSKMHCKVVDLDVAQIL
jgi:hypothetical protein